MAMKTKIVIVGAGSAVFAKGLIESLLLFDDIKIDNISLVDIDLKKLKVMEQVARKMCKQVNKEIEIVATDKRREVLSDATYVINSIGVGGPQVYKRDLEIADKYGVIENVGDIIGPTGIFRMLRAYPEMLGMCKDMEELCPGAYFFNYTNPMAPLCLALTRETTIKVFGYCHSVQGTAAQLANYLDVELQRVSYWAAGINHMAWFLQYKVDRQDAYPLLFELAKSEDKINAASIRDGLYATYLLGNDFSDLVRFEVMKHFGYFPSESPFHMSEYVPYFRKNSTTIKRWRVNRRWWLEHELSADTYFEMLEKMVASDEPIPMQKSNEYAPDVIHANLTGQPFRANLNVPNTGLIENLPKDSCVEVPCYADADGIHPCYVGKLPDAVAALNMSNINMHKLMADAANEKKLEYIYQAVQVDPLTAAICDLTQIRAMVSELIENNQKYLVDYK
ncbi:MAG: alpha-galactosidase [Phycisphaerales bacterium]